MEINRMLGTEEAVVVGTEAGPGPAGVPTTTAAAEGAGGSEPRAWVTGQPRPDPAVPEKPVRRRFDAEYKAGILREADHLTAPGRLGGPLRREGLSPSHLSVWRKQRDKAALAGLVPKRRGRKPDPNAALVAENQRLVRETLVKEGIHRDQLTTHSDRCPAMRSQAVAQLLATLGVTKSHSRPHVSDGKPFPESQFQTLKYRPDFPDRFANFERGLDFCRSFFRWHDDEHRHWGIGLLTPADAHARHPERFVHGLPRPLTPAAEVWINPPENKPQVRTLELPHDGKFVPQVSQSH